ncbi:tellurite resistance TerB family protein [Amycolatopsis samaneae]|uniref:Co-chaperone DjlA N-terminal domain-containing protein n=1 Tax=Amycolatopsis samaneae TaxID=664691 RepID=A0ABW5GXK9_9PSEU
MAADPMLRVSEFARDDYGISAVSEPAMRNYGYALLTIAGADGEVSPAELDWLVRHQRKFGTPQHILDDYATFDHRDADLRGLLTAIRVDVPTWSAGRHLVYHAIRICRADGAYPEAERAKVFTAAELLGVERDIVLALHALVDAEDALTNLRKAVFRTDT